MKKFFRHIFVVLIFSFIFALSAKYYIHLWSKQEISVSAKTNLDFPPQTTLKKLAKNLKSKNLIDHELKFRALVKTNYNYTKFQAGTYFFENRVSPSQIAESLLRGKIAPEASIVITIPEGFTLKQIFKRLEANELGLEKTYWKLARDKMFLIQNNIRATNLEGFLYPETYFFTKNTTEEQVLKTMIKTFFANLPPNYLEKLKEMRITLKEAVTFASLIEMETSIPEERSKISEVIWNRLKRKIPIGIDAAIIYGIEDYDGDIRTRDLRNRKNLYNTRIHLGLPPTPIGSPAKDSLLAVTTPTSYGYYYYVVKAGTSYHHFSKTLKEHNRYVRKLSNYLKN